MRNMRIFKLSQNKTTKKTRVEGVQFKREKCNKNLKSLEKN